MIREHFTILSKDEQQDVVLKEGIFLAEREDGPFRVMLYQLNYYYVEVYFVNRYNKVSFFKTFENTETLKPYLKKIDLTDLLQEVFS